MKAAILDEKGISCREVDEPMVGGGQVKVKVAYCGICGSDIPRVVDGKVHFYPIILGHEFSGTVAEVGKGVTRFKTGDRVAGIPLIPCMECDSCAKGFYSLCSDYRFIGSSVYGAYAEFVCVPEDKLFIISDSINLVDASMIEPCSVARHAFGLAEVRGKDVAVIGSGTIGLFAVQWAKIMGARSVTMVTHGRKDLPLTILKADAVVASDDCQSKADVIIDCAGTEDSIMMDLEMAKPRCFLVIVGTSVADITFPVKQWQKIARKEMTVKGSWMSYSRPFPGLEWTDTIDKMANGQITTDVIPRTIIEIEDLSDVFSEIAEGRRRGKTIIRIADD